MTNVVTYSVAIFAAACFTLVSMSAAIAVPSEQAAVLIMPVLA